MKQTLFLSLLSLLMAPTVALDPSSAEEFWLKFNAWKDAQQVVAKQGGVRGMKVVRDLKKDDKNQGKADKDQDKPAQEGDSVQNESGPAQPMGALAPVDEQYDCVSHSSAMGWIANYDDSQQNPTSDAECLDATDPFNACSGGCCRLAYSSFCDTSGEGSAYSNFPCTCNINTRNPPTSPPTDAPLPPVVEEDEGTVAPTEAGTAAATMADTAAVTMAATGVATMAETAAETVSST